MTAIASTGMGALLERDHSMAVLDGQLDSVRSSSEGRLVVVGGEAGVGKTSLLRYFCESQAAAVRILWGACEPLRTPRPLGPFMDVAGATGGELRELVVRMARPYEVAGALVGELRGGGPTVLVIEDVHWADEATLDVLISLGARISLVPALVLASYREEEVSRSAQLRFVLGEVVRRTARLKLDPLSSDAVAELARPHQVDAEELYRRTGGNPFFVTEVLAAGGERIPETLRDAVLSRSARLSAPARRLLEAVAVVPGQVELWLLEALAGDLLEWLDECLASGMVVAARGAVTFRHELARLAIEESLGPHHLVALHRSALEALRRRSPDPARLAHHAEMAGDGAAVLEFAPAAARRAASAGAHREAAAQYARAVRFADGGLGLSERGELLERLSEELSMIAEQQDAVSAASAAVDCYRTLGDRRKQANALCTLARCLYCPGESIGGAHQAAREAVEVLEDEPPCRELARAYALMAAVSMNAEDVDRAFEWGPRAVELAERLGDQDILVYALNDLGTIEYLTGAPGGRERLERSLRLALEAGFEAHAARAYVHLAWVATRIREYGVAAHYVREGIAYCTERDLDMYRHYLFTRRAQLELGRGQWDEAAESAMLVADDPRSGPDARAPAFAVLALVRARRGDPDHAPVLEQAIALAESGDLQRTGPVAAARAEILWLERRLDQIDQATRPTLELSVRCKAPWMAGELAYWRWRAGLRDELPAELIAEPYRLSIAGDWAPAADLWNQIGCPYEAALALAESQDQHAVSQAIEQLQQLGAPPPAAIFARRLRERGVRGVPRGPRPGTRENPAGLTARELEVLELLAEGLANAQIAERLVVSRKTVDHHVSAILRKLNARTRGEASAHASRLGIASPR